LPECAVAVKKQSAEAILKTIQGHLRTSGGHLLAPLIKARKGFHTDVAENAAKHGIETLWVDGEFKPTMGFKRLERFKEHSIDAVIAKVGRRKCRRFASVDRNGPQDGQRHHQAASRR
jgi:excinuclease ABC subunit A